MRDVELGTRNKRNVQQGPTYAEDNNIVCSAIVAPMIRETRWVLLVQILRVVLFQVRECVEEALIARLLTLTNNHLLVNSLISCLTPIGTKDFGVDDEVLPEFGIGLVVIGPWREPKFSVSAQTFHLPYLGICHSYSVEAIILTMFTPRLTSLLPASVPRLPANRLACCIWEMLYQQDIWKNERVTNLQRRTQTSIPAEP